MTPPASRRRPTRPRSAAAALAIALTGAVLAASPPAVSAASPTAPGSDPTAITLITGDVVQVTELGGGRRSVEVRAGAGRSDIVFYQREEAGAFSVIPSDALGLVSDGTLDARLFDVTALTRDGYADPARDALPLIVGHTGDRTPAALASADGADVRHELRSIDATAVTEDHDRAAGFWADLVRETGAGGSARLKPGLTKVWLDAPVEARDDVGNVQMGVPAARAAGYTGEGVKVAVLDTGVKRDHPDLQGKVTSERNLITGSANADDDNGHGTHVAGIVAGSGAASGGRYEGVAPGASLLIGKVMDAGGSGLSSDIVAGMEWAVAQGADVVNLSLGTRAPSTGTDPLSDALNSLSANSDTLFVVAAGNTGPDATTIGAPGAADTALTVGAVDSTGAIASFSSRGPRLGDGALKPDITAPGVAVVSARAKGTPVGDVDPAGPQGPIDDNYTALSGTSMATPATAGAVALLAQRHPDWDGERLKDALMSTANPQPGQSVLVQGSGLADVARGTGQSVTASPASTTVGPFTWPHTAHKAETRTVTYRNDGDGPVALTVRPSLTSPEGATAPEGTLRLSADEVTVPAHGTATLDVAIDPTTGIPAGGGTYAWRLEATTADGGTRVETLVGAQFEEESHTLSLTALDRNGNTPVAPYWTAVVIHRLDQTGFAPSALINTATPEARVRLPKGRYALTALTTTTNPDTRAVTDTTLDGRPAVDLGSDVSVRFDARKGRPASVGVPDDTVTPLFRDFGAQTTAVDAAGNRENSSFGVFSPYYSTSALSAVPTPATERDASFRYYHRTTLAATTDPEALLASPVYSLLEEKKGGIPGRLSYDVPLHKLAKVNATYGKRDGSRAGAARIISGFLGGQTSLVSVVRNVPLAAKRVEYYSADPDVTWTGVLGPYMTPDGDSYYSLGSQRSNPRSYRPGTTTEEAWNLPVVGPALPVNGQFLDRTGNRITPALSLWGDSDPNHYNYNDRAFSRGSATLYRNGTLVGRLNSPWQDETHFDNFTSFWDVPAGDADYRLDVSASRSTSWHGQRSQRIDAAWTFSSATTETSTALPLTVLRFQPRTDLNGLAPAATEVTLPFTVQQQGPGGHRRLDAVKVEVSYDDGTTWTTVPAKVRGTAGLATVTHPAAGSGNGWVSLRATGTDHSGNTFSQQVIRAYPIG
ncbi:S8 family peptidase [Streptomyces sp. SID13726]|uniref:S8 family peptidase n=1 Tax=Streptomyces sp. SID13726 TaxID=2706058 RepID=UPI0013BBC341|nr:S8 family peptidase [Streptomyces sp. SID13726]NEA98546.1 S8 family peptidase [Streptomyces sp. SID13726]